MPETEPISLNATAVSPEGPCEGRFEEKSSGFHQAIRSGYLDIAENNSTRFYIVDGREDLSTVHRLIQSAVLKKLEEHKG